MFVAGVYITVISMGFSFQTALAIAHLFSFPYEVYSSYTRIQNPEHNPTPLMGFLQIITNKYAHIIIKQSCSTSEKILLDVMRSFGQTSATLTSFLISKYQPQTLDDSLKAEAVKGNFVGLGEPDGWKMSGLQRGTEKRESYICTSLGTSMIWKMRFSFNSPTST